MEGLANANCQPLSLVITVLSAVKLYDVTIYYGEERRREARKLILCACPESALAEIWEERRLMVEARLQTNRHTVRAGEVIIGLDGGIPEPVSLQLRVCGKIIRFFTLGIWMQQGVDRGDMGRGIMNMV